MTDLQKTIEYVFKVTDQSSGTLQTIQDKTDTTKASVDGLTSSTVRAKDESESLTASLDKQQVSMIATLATIASLRAGVSGIVSSVQQLGLVSDETAKQLQMVNAGFGMFASAVQIIKSVQGVMTALNTQLAIMDVLETYSATLKNPAMMAVAGIATGAAVGVAGAFLLNNNSTTTNTTTINVQDTTPRDATSQIYNVVTGGAL